MGERRKVHSVSRDYTPGKCIPLLPYLILNGHGHILALLEQLGQTHTTVQQLLGGSIQIGTELSEGSDLTVLGQLQLHGTGDLLHGLGLGSGTDTGDRETHVDGGTDTLVEQLSFQEDLTVSDRNDVGWNVGGHITGLGLNDGQGGQGTTSHSGGHLGGTLQQTRMQVEHITGIGLTTWGTTQQQRHLTVGNSLLGQIIVDDQGVLALVTEVFTHGTARVGSQILQGSGIGGGGRDDDRVTHGTGVGQTLHNLGDGGTLLANSDVDAEQFLGLILTLVETLLVNDGINSQSSLTAK